MTATVRTLLERALETLDALGSQGEEIEDEWTYVTDLVAAQRFRFELIAERRGDEPVSEATGQAAELAADEARLIADPHRAIDWLSTFPELVALAIGEPVGGGPAPASTGGA